MGGISTSRLLHVPDEECDTKATIRVITGMQVRDTGKPMFPLSSGFTKVSARSVPHRFMGP